MPREAGKKNNWEKERRERFNKAFDELAKVLPGYVPTENLSRIEILTKSTSTILELKEEINKFSKSSEDKESCKDDLIKKLQGRVKKLLQRNEQLAQLFKDAGINVSKVFGTKTFKRPLPYSQIHKRIPAQEQQKENDPEKSKMEDASRSNSVLPPKTKTSNQGRKCSKSSNKTTKPPKPKKFAKVTQNPNPLVLFSRVPTIPTITQQFLLLQNAPVVNNTRSAVVRISTGSKARKPKKSPAKRTVTPTNPALSTLGPGTLILANGNIISLVSQPQVIVPPVPLNSTNAAIHSSPNVNKLIRKNQPIKSCVTNTTQINKIPIPALTSKYANTSILKKSQERIDKNTLPKVKSVKNTGVKRKLNEKHDKALKKSKICDNCEKQKDSTNKNDKIIVDKNKTAEEKPTETSEIVVATTNTNETVSSTNNNPSSDLVPTMSSNNLIPEASAADQTLKLIDEVDKSNKSLNKSNNIQKEVTSDDTSDKAATNKDTSSPSCPLLVSSESSMVTCTTTPITVSCTTPCLTTVSNTIHEENMKNIDLNLVHSDLSNDIFASLQVPPGCQNMESTSPTAAFLLAFPIVSSIKVTEVIDEDNSDSQRETPTLLQIGMDNSSKPSNNEALLSLENFSFFNSKDMYYNTKLENGTREENETEKNNNANEESKTKSNEELGNNFEVFSKPDQLDNNPVINQQVNMFNQQDSCNMMDLNAFQAPTNELPGVLEQKNSSERKGTNTEQYSNLIQENLLANSMNVSYNISAGNLCKESIEEINFKDCKTSRVNTVNNITSQEHSAAAEPINNTFNTQNGVPLSTFPSNTSKMPESISTSLEKLSDVTKMRETFQYNNKHLEQTKNFPMTLKTVEKPNQSLEKGSTGQKMEQYRYPVLQNELDNYEQLKNTEKLNTNKTRDNFSYNPKHFLQNEHHINNFPSKLLDNSSQNLQKPDQKEFLHVNNFSSKLLENSGQNVQKSDVNKERDNYQYHPKQFLQNEHNLNMFSTNSVKLPERAEQTVEKSEKNKTYQYNQKHYVQADNSGATFASTSSKMLENVEKSAKTYHYTNNPFEIVPTTKEVSLNIGDGCNVKERQKSTDNKGIDDACAKPIDEKACYFTSNYTSTSYRPNTSVVRSDSSKVCHTASYENGNNKNYTNPFYTNCNYNYADTSFNQNYYKSEKSCYSLNYENYQEYRKSDTTFNRDRRSSTTKEKQVMQNKPVNWMTTTEQKSSDCFLPSFTNQSYSFSSCINSESEINPLCDTKKSTDFSDKRFTWSPSKLPNFLEPSHNFITPTLPTLVGDLALGNALPLTEPKNDAYKCPKEAKRKTYDNQANFLSVSQLVNQSKTDPAPAKTMSRRLSGSKSTKTTTNKLKRCEKTVDKSTKPVNTYSDVFYDQKNRSSTKNISSNYSAEALIGNQCPQEEKKYPQNIGSYFPSVDDNYVNQNQNFHTYTHNSFQNNSYSTNSFIYTTPISTNYLNNTFDNTLDYSAESIMNYNKNCNKNSRTINKEEKTNYGGNSKKQKKTSQGNATSLANFEYPLLPIQGSTNSPLLPDDFQSHTTFLPPTTPYPCKNTLYQKQGNDFNTAPLLPIPGITRASIQHPEVSPSLNHVGTSLTNFNLSTIFPEINKGTIPNVHNNSNKSKNSSSYLQGPFSAN
ncbi:uncharacterized protein [Diabrotica undecimpunctata]|uniref:uncharacterized protein isoform X2 n=1 Tax=Diabrotica undecimpunctata TaxID=50387 RepID=UPI003B63CB58